VTKWLRCAITLSFHAFYKFVISVRRSINMRKMECAMRQATKPYVLAFLCVGALLSGCARQEERPPQAAASLPDDDALCQSKGFKPGSDGYVNCRRDRDHVGGLQADQGKRDLRKIQDYMMDNK
jgi:hypothetical protein